MTAPRSPEPPNVGAHACGQENSRPENSGPENSGTQPAGTQHAGTQPAGQQNTGQPRTGPQHGGPQHAGQPPAGSTNAGSPATAGSNSQTPGTDRAEIGPAARGVRTAWQSLPAPVRSGIERICGAAVLRADSQPGGFSPGVAARLTCSDATRWFVKAVSAEVNSVSPGMHRREGEVLRALDPLIAAGWLAAPRLHGILDRPPWMALVLTDIDGDHPALPWRPAELAAVLAAVDRLAAPTPSPIAIASLADQFGEDFTGWQRLAAGPARDRLDSWSLDHLGRLLELERAWPAHAGGDTLVHADIRADNILLTADGPVILDWPHACIGAAFTDLVFLAPSVAMQGGPEPGELLTMTRAGRAASRDAVAATVCALAGFFTERSLRPPPPGIPTVREFQAAQGLVARRWLATLL